MYLNSDIRPDHRVESRNSAGSWLIRRILAGMQSGHVSVIMPSGERIDHAGREPGPHAVIELHHASAFRRVLAGGAVGFAEGYIAGEWTSPDLPALLALAGANTAHLSSAISGFAPVRLWRRLAHALRRNSRKGSRRNIAYHYDLGNDFYRLWLDESMAYSSAIAIAPGQTLEQAQRSRFQHIAGLLRLDRDSEVLEIGCGWGGLASTLAPLCRKVTGLTLSTEQLSWARQLAEAEGLTGRVDLRLQDYREIEGQFDRIVSIEMIEAVGEAYWPAYFGQLRRCLKADGRIVIQAITIAPERYEAYRQSPDFIQQYIFPGGMLPTPGIITEHAERAGLRLVECQTFARGYAATLAEWRRRFLAAWSQVARQGFDDRFRRTWDYYLSYCEAGFRIGTIDVGLYVLEPGA